MTDDDTLTREEIARWRLIKIKAERPYGNTRTLGFELAHAGSWRFMQFSIKLIWLHIHFRFMTYDAYERHVLALGPYRNA